MNISKFGTSGSQSSSTVKVVGIEHKVSKSGDIMYGDLNLNNHKITNLANPVTESDSVNKGFLDNAISNIVHFAESSEFGSRLATLGINNDDQYVVSPSQIQIQRSQIYGVEVLGRLPNRVFRIENIPPNNASIELGESLILKGLVDPILPSDAATKQFVENLVTNVRDNINLQGLHTIINLRDPTAPGEAANKNYVDQITQHIQTEDDNVTISRNLDMKNHTIFNVGRPSEPTSAINKRYFKRNIYRPKFQIFLGASSTPDSRPIPSSAIHSVRTNTDHNLHFVSAPLVAGNDFLSLQSDSIHLRDEVTSSYIEISISGLVKVTSYDDEDKLYINIIRVSQEETDKICKTTVTPPFDCFNLNCIVFPNPSRDVFRIQYNYVSSNSSVSMNISSVVIKVKQLEMGDQPEA